jgi:hypothetical protein
VDGHAMRRCRHGRRSRTITPHKPVAARETSHQDHDCPRGHQARLQHQQFQLLPIK